MRSLAWILLSALVVLPAAQLGSRALAQEPPVEVPEPPTGDEPAPEVEALPPASDEETDLIDDLLADSEESLDTVLVYNPGDRRDPFRSLVRTTEPNRPAGPRPEGLPGLLIDELKVTGVLLTKSGPVAQVQSSDNPVSFLIRPGDQLFDGEVVDVRYARGEGGEVVFRQVINDPQAPKPFREVVKRLSP